MNAISSFITGSRIYGSPTSNSDLDLVILVSKDEAEIIKKHADANKNLGDDKVYARHEHDDDILICRYGILNLIMFTDARLFNVWQAGTEECIECKPVTRNFAKAAMIMGTEFMKRQIALEATPAIPAHDELRIDFQNEPMTEPYMPTEAELKPSIGTRIQRARDKYRDAKAHTIRVAENLYLSVDELSELQEYKEAQEARRFPPPSFFKRAKWGDRIYGLVIKKRDLHTPLIYCD